MTRTTSNDIVTGDAPKEQATDQFKSLSDGHNLVVELAGLAARAEKEVSTVAEPFKPTVQAIATALKAQASRANESLNAASRATEGTYKATTEQEENAEDTKAQLGGQERSLGPQSITPPPSDPASGPSPSGPGLITI